MNKTLLQRYIFLFLAMGVGYCPAQDFDKGTLLNGPGFRYEAPRALDADRDGDLDILCFPYLYLNDGQGKKQQTLVVGDPRQQYENYGVADMDGDKDMDIVVLYKSGFVDIILNQPGGFKVKEQTKKISYFKAEYAKLYLYDANSDGIRDIIILGLQGPSTAYIGDSAQQYSYFKAFNRVFPKAGEVFGVDINKDGIAELIAPRYDQNRNTVLDAFAFQSDAYTLVQSFPITTSGIKNIKMVDIDKDGDLDLAFSSGYTSGGIYWLERNGKGGFGATHTLLTPVSVEDFQLGDFDADGDLDIAYHTRQNQYTKVNWAKNNGNFKYAADQKSLLPNIRESRTFLFEDFDGDKIKDVLFYDDDQERIRGRYTLALQTKTRQVKAQSTWMMSARLAGFALNDLNADGNPDIIGYMNHELFYMLVTPDGSYAAPESLAVCPFAVGQIRFDDLDSDGKDDLLVSSDDGDHGQLGWYKNEGNGKPGAFTMLHDEKERLIDFDVLDYNGDAHPDIVVNYWKSTLYGFYTYKNEGKGIFSKTRAVVTEETKEFLRLGVWDVNGDGKKDILDYKSAHWFQYTAAGTWEKQKSPFQGYFIKTVLKAKVDSDPAPQYLLLGSQGIQWLKNTSDPWQSTAIPNTHSTEMLRAGDMNGDGFDDIVCVTSVTEFNAGDIELTYSYKYSVALLTNDQTGKFTAKALFPVNNVNNLELQDVDKDGDLDIIVSGSYFPSEGIWLWKNLGK